MDSDVGGDGGWIPACAGMTGILSGVTPPYGPPAPQGDWIAASAAMTGYAKVPASGNDGGRKAGR